MKKIKLDKKEISKLIESGDTCEGNHILVVESEGTARTDWMDRRSSYRPRHDDDFVAAIPALDPDGSGRETEDAWGLIRIAELCSESKEEIEVICDEQDISVAEFLEQNYPEDWKVERENSLYWIAGEWLLALNGEPNDLHEDPEHYFWEWNGEKEAFIDRAFEFEWETE